jgi:sulfatase maturation enzyme AslB (radical SAM superfamily)
MSTFCPLPWNSINLRNNGDLRVCCNTNSYSPNRGIMRREDGIPYNAGRDDLNDARNAEIIKEIRSFMMKGEWHPECERCRQEEINGIRSRREYESRDWDLSLEDVIDKTEEDGTINPLDFDIEFFDIRYGNFCNLKCRMCGPTDSHSWYDDFVKLHGTTEYKDTHDLIKLTKNEKGRWSTDQYDWFKNSNFYWNNFEKHTKKAKKLYIVGGEPLIIPEHVESLERLVASGRASEVEIEYNTNLTNVTDRMLELWENFKQIRIGVSIDGYADVFEYQRTPAKWNHVYKNMKKLNDNRNINLKCWFAFTVTAYNVFHVPEFMKWKLEESELDRFNPTWGVRPIITQHMCHSPKYFNVKVLPALIKDEVSERYQQYIDWILSSDHPNNVKQEFVHICDGIIDFMNSEDYAKDWLKSFVFETQKLDEIRNQDIKKVVPELSMLFNE